MGPRRRSTGRAGPSSRDRRRSIWRTSSSAFAGRPDRQADQTNYISYGPGNKEAIANINPKIKPDLPTNPDNMKTGFIVDAKFWADNGDSLRERFTVWLAK